MTTKYRKLDQAELKKLWENLSGFFAKDEYRYTNLIKLVEKHFPVGAATILISVSSEYNDETYDNSINSVSVYDKDDMEIPLSRINRDEFNKSVLNLYLITDGTDDSMKDIVIYINKQIPDIYIEEK